MNRPADFVPRIVHCCDRWGRYWIEEDGTGYSRRPIATISFTTWSLSISFDNIRFGSAYVEPNFILAEEKGNRDADWNSLTKEQEAFYDGYDSGWSAKEAENEA